MSACEFKLVKSISLVFLVNSLHYAEFQQCKLQMTAFPWCLNQSLQRECQVLRFALVEEGCEHADALLVEEGGGHVCFLNEGQELEDPLPNKS